MSSSATRENKILTKISGFTVKKILHERSYFIEFIKRVIKRDRFVRFVKNFISFSLHVE